MTEDERNEYNRVAFQKRMLYRALHVFEGIPAKEILSEATMEFNGIDPDELLPLCMPIGIAPGEAICTVADLIAVKPNK